MKNGTIIYSFALILLGILCLVPHAMHYYEGKLCFLMFVAAIIIFSVVATRIGKNK